MILLDTTPLRENPSFLRLWIGTSAQSLGRQFTSLAVLYQVWDMTGNPFWTGALGLVYAVPMLVSGLTGGAFADRLDRRGIIMATTIGAFCVALLLVLQAALDVASLWLLFILAAAQAAFTAFGSPARRAIIPQLLPRSQIGAGIALSQAGVQVSRLAGPALAGVLIAEWGVTACYLAEALAFCVAFLGVAGLPKIPPDRLTRPHPVVAIRDGLGFVGRNRLLSGSLWSDLAAMFLAVPTALFPALNDIKFDGDPQTLGLLFSAVAAGGIAAVAMSGPFARVERIGVVQMTAAACWGAALVGSGLADDMIAVLFFLALAGASDSAAVITRGTLLQLATPDTHRGRVSSVEDVVAIAGPEVGNFRAGIVATMLSPISAIVIGGTLCVLAIGTIAASNPDLRRYRRDNP